jgi:hypothetical protein
MTHETSLTINEDNEKDVIAPNLEDKSGEALDTKEDTQNSTDEMNKLDRWNQPRINMYRYFTTLFCLIIMGMNDAAYGVSPKVVVLGEPADVCKGFNSICEIYLLHSFGSLLHSHPYFITINLSLLLLSSDFPYAISFALSFFQSAPATIFIWLLYLIDPLAASALPQF